MSLWDVDNLIQQSAGIGSQGQLAKVAPVSCLAVMQEYITHQNWPDFSHSRAPDLQRNKTEVQIAAYLALV